MKITYDKDYTLPVKVSELKEAMKEFKAMYTDGDLLNFFRETLDVDPAHCSEIITVKVTAFMGVYDPQYCVEIIAADSTGFCKITYYCDQNLKIDETPCLWDISLFDKRYA